MNHPTEAINYQEILATLPKDWEKTLTDFRISTGLELFSDLYTELVTDDKPQTIPIGNMWPQFVMKTGGLRLGELTVLTGDTGSGKTTLATNLLFQVAESHTPSFTFSLEMGPKAVIKKLIRNTVGLRPTSDNVSEYHEKLSEWFLTHKIYFLNYQGYLQYEQARTIVAWAAIERKCRFVVIDHFEMILNTVTEAAVISRMVAGIRELAHKLNCHIIAIVHPSKRGQRDAQERQTEMDEIKGSSGFKQFADNVFAIHFDKKNKVSSLKLHKIRDDDYGKYQGDEIAYSLGEMSLFFREQANG